MHVRDGASFLLPLLLLCNLGHVTSQVWLQQRRSGRDAWRCSMEITAAGLAGVPRANGGLTGGGSGGAAKSDDNDEDEEGYGDPPEAKALLEELGERPSAGKQQRS